MKLVNLTPHPVDIYRGDEKILSIEPSGMILRVPMVKKKNGLINEILVYAVKYRLPSLPKPEKDTFYIVSSTVLQAMKMNNIQRDDFIAPDIDDAVRDRNGRIIGVRGFIRMR